jgi:hypothetical protein
VVPIDTSASCVIETKGDPDAISVDELRENKECYYGRVVTVEGEMHRAFNDRTFTIEDDDFFSDDDLLVISTVPASQVITALDEPEEVEVDACCPNAAVVEEEDLEGQDVQLTGLVRPYDRAKLECAYGPLDLESREGHSFTDGPVLIVGPMEPPKMAPPVERSKPAPPPEPAPAPEPQLPEPAPAPLPPAPALPQTSSDLPLTAMLGVFALFAAYGVRLSRGGLVRDR